MSDYEESEGDNSGRLERWLEKSNKTLFKWGPLVGTTLGTLVAIGFGILTIFSYLEQRAATRIAFDALVEARKANDLAETAISLASFNNNQTWHAYVLERAQFLMDQIYNCRAFYPDLTEQVCTTISSWANQYATTVASFFTPTSTPEVETPSANPPPTPAPAISPLSEYYQAAHKEKESTSVVSLFVPTIIGAVAIAVVVLAVRATRKRRRNISR